MTKKEAKLLGSQLNIIAKNGDDLYDQLVALGMQIGVEHDTGDWVVLNSQKQVIARLA